MGEIFRVPAARLADSAIWNGSDGLMGLAGVWKSFRVKSFYRTEVTRLVSIRLEDSAGRVR